MLVPLFPNNQPPLELRCIWWIYVCKMLYNSGVLYDFYTADPLSLFLFCWYLTHVFYPPRN